MRLNFADNAHQLEINQTEANVWAKLLKEWGLVSSNNEGQRAIKQGAVHVFPKEHSFYCRVGKAHRKIVEIFVDIEDGSWQMEDL